MLPVLVSRGLSEAFIRMGDLHNAVVPETLLFQDLFDFVNQHREVALGFCHGQTTGREGNTCRRRQSQTRVIDVVQAVLL